MDRLIEAHRQYVARVELQLFKPSPWWRRLFRWLMKWRQPMATIKLGDKVRDNVSGFTGIAIGRTAWLHGCDRITIQPPVDKDGKHQDAATFDEQQVELVKAQPVKVSAHAGEARPGGPRPEPARKKTPSRR